MRVEAPSPTLAMLSRQYATDWASQFGAFLFLGLVFWPYSAVDRQLTVAFLVAVSIAALAVRPLQLPVLSKPLLVFIAYFLAIVFLDVLRGGAGSYYLSHSNHVLQFSLYYVALSKIVQSCECERLLSSTGFIAFGLLYSAVYYYFVDDIDVNMALYATIIGIFLRGYTERRLATFLLLAAIAVIVALNLGRASVVLVMSAVLLLYWWRPDKRLVVSIASLIVLAPLIFYMALDVPALRWLYLLDHNTAIRAEFIQGASTLLQQSPFFGIGFDAPYRPTAYPYVGSHPYLNYPAAVQSISNHHSLFDIALRLGIPIALLFWVGLIRTQRKEGDGLFALLCVIAAIGLSFNAWFENQYQLPQFVLTIALLQWFPKRSNSSREGIEARRTSSIRPVWSRSPVPGVPNVSLAATQTVDEPGRSDDQWSQIGPSGKPHGD
jgi:hypothetical protein